MSDLLSELIEGLSVKARFPDVHGYKPHPKQEEFHRSSAKGKVFLGGNRSGKTVSAVVEMIWWASGFHPYPPLGRAPLPKPPLNLRHLAVDDPRGVQQILLPIYRRWTPSNWLEGGAFDKAYNKTSNSLKFANGSTIYFLTYEQDLDKHAGTSMHAVAFDEEPEQAIFQENMARLIDTDGSWWLSMTPIEGLTWVFTDLYLPYSENRVEKEDLLIVEVNTSDNPNVNAKAADRLYSTLDEESKETRLSGSFRKMSGLIYSSFQKEFHVLPETYDLQPRAHQVFCGMDHGLRNATAFLWAYLDGEGNLVVFDEHYKEGWVISQHCQVVNQKNDLYRPTYTVGDPAIATRNPVNGQSIQTEYSNHGVFIGLGNNDVTAGINRVYTLFENNKLYVHPNCTHLIKELGKYMWGDWGSKKASMKRDPKTSPRKKDDHACDALRYLVMSRPASEFNLAEGELAPDLAPPNLLGQLLGAVPVAHEEVYDRTLVQSGPWDQVPNFDQFPGFEDFYVNDEQEVW